PGNMLALQYLSAAKNNLPINGLQSAQILNDVRTAPTAEKYIGLSLSYYQQNKFSQCIEAANEALKLEPGSAEAYNNIGAAYNALKQYDKAEQALRKALA